MVTVTKAVVVTSFHPCLHNAANTPPLLARVAVAVAEATAVAVAVVVAMAVTQVVHQSPPAMERMHL